MPLKSSTHFAAVLKADAEPHTAASLEQLSFYIARAYYNFLALLERTLDDTGLSGSLRPGMGLILQALYERDDLIIKDIAARTQLTPSTLSGMLGKMKRAGLITLRKDAADKRAVRVKLTIKGRSIERRFDRLNSIINGVLEAGLSDEEIHAAKSSLSRIVANMRLEDQRRRAEAYASKRN